MRYSLVIMLALMFGGCATVQHGRVDPAPVHRGYRDPFGWVGKLAAVTLPLSFVVDAVVVVPVAVVLDRPFYEWFPVTKAVFRVMDLQEPVPPLTWNEQDYSDWPEVESQ